MNRWRVLSLVVLLGLLWTCPATAVVKQYVNPGTVVTFADAAQAPTVTFTLSGLGTLVGQYSARYDKGAGAQPARWQISCHAQLTGANVLGEKLEIYVVRWDSGGTNADGNFGTTTSSFVTDKRRNLQFIGLLVVDQPNPNTTMAVNLHDVYIPGRYFSLAVWNASSLNLKADTTVHGCAAWPMPPEMQNPQ